MKISFKQSKFYPTVNDLKCLPSVNKEIAIVGRSNAGKSSLLNALTNQNKLAFTSKTPGRTQHINYFTIAEDLYLVDLPGYGYAKVPEDIRRHWVGLLGNYLGTRREIVGLVLIMDCRHPLKDLDLQMIDFFSLTNKPLHIVLSKADKLNKQERTKTMQSVRESLARYGLEHLSLQMFSSPKKEGVDELEIKLNEWLV